MRYLSLVIFVLFLAACGFKPPTDLGGGTSDPTPTPTVSPTPDDNDNPNDPTTKTDKEKPFRPCVLVEEFQFNKSTNKETWKPSYYYNAPEKYPLSFESDGVHFKGSSGYRSGVTIDLGNRDVSGCPSLAFRVQGTINQQTLGGAGYDNREAPLAVMIQYTDGKGVKHSSLTAFNEGETDDRKTTRMFWWGFGYLNPTYNFGYNFTPSITAVKQNVKFDETSKDILPNDIKVIHTVTIEASGWALESVLHQFAMKPLEAFADPEAPYRDVPNQGGGNTGIPSVPQGNVTQDMLQGSWTAVNPILAQCTRSLFFFDRLNFDYSQQCDPFVDAAYAFRYGTYTLSGSTISFTASGKDGLAPTFIFGNDMQGSAKITVLSDRQLMFEDSATKEVNVFEKDVYHP